MLLLTVFLLNLAILIGTTSVCDVCDCRHLLRSERLVRCYCSDLNNATNILENLRRINASNVKCDVSGCDDVTINDNYQCTTLYINNCHSLSIDYSLERDYEALIPQLTVNNVKTVKIVGPIENNRSQTLGVYNLTIANSRIPILKDLHIKSLAYQNVYFKNVTFGTIGTTGLVVVGEAKSRFILEDSKVGHLEEKAIIIESDHINILSTAFKGNTSEIKLIARQNSSIKKNVIKQSTRGEFFNVYSPVISMSKNVFVNNTGKN